MPQPEIKIRRQNRKNLMMRPIPGGLEVFIPHWMKEDDPQVKKFIRQGKKQLKDHIKPPPDVLTTEVEIKAMVKKWSSAIGVTATRVQFRQMYRKWGSCSSKGTVTLNRALTWMPPHLAEYVVVHELVHLIELNHGSGFQKLMTQHMPDWRDRQAEIRRSYSTFGDCTPD
ncbi:MAG: M48 family metallopeptidase [Chloroflexota bacterium]